MSHSFVAGEPSPETVYLTVDYRLAENVKLDDPHGVYVNEGDILTEEQAERINAAFDPRIAVDEFGQESANNPSALRDEDVQSNVS